MEAKKPLTSLPSLPHLGDRIKVSRETLQSENTWVVQKASEISGKLKNKCSVSPFMKFLRERNLKSCHILALDQWIAMLSKQFPKVKDTVFQTIIFTLLKKFGDCSCEADSKHVEIVTASFLRFVDIENKNYSKFPPWSFGIHRQENKNKYLFGYLEISSIYGFVTLSDETYQLVCGYTNKENRDISEVATSYVVIKKYMIITEIYSEKNAKNIEFLFFDLQDVQKIHSIKVFPTHFPNAEPPMIHYNFNVSFTVLKKANVRYIKII